MRTHRLTALPMLLVATGGLVVGLAVPAAGREASHLINGSSIKPHSVAGNRLKDNTLTGKQVKESTLHMVPKAKRAETLPALKWHSVTLLNHWHDAGAAANEPRVGYAVDAEGIVHLRGSINQGTSAAAFTLPPSVLSGSVGFIIPVAISGTDLGYLEFADNNVLALSGANSPGTAAIDTDLDGVSFVAS
jgi:hypothetical protein